MKVLKKSNYTYLYTKYRRNAKLGLILSLMSIPAFVLGFYFTISISIILGFMLLAVGISYFVSASHYKAGIEGEKAVAEALEQLDDSYYLINDIMAGAMRNIDHVLMSTKGIFIIETKNYTGDVRCDGNRWRKKGRRRLYEIPSVSKQANFNAHYLSNLIRRKLNLSIQVMPICVFTNEGVELKLRKPTVPVLRLHELVEFVREAPPMTTLTDSEIQSLSQCILGKRYKDSIDRENIRES